uniref:DUF3475 domain-containing protein n=1 Tax=Oryza glumipatula TaxID=40148 RepID=A0A0D9Y807_9ORYZ
MSRLVSLYCSLSDAEVRRLRADALRAEGVSRVTYSHPRTSRSCSGSRVVSLWRTSTAPPAPPRGSGRDVARHAVPARFSTASTLRRSWGTDSHGWM